MRKGSWISIGWLFWGPCGKTGSFKPLHWRIRFGTRGGWSLLAKPSIAFRLPTLLWSFCQWTRHHLHWCDIFGPDLRAQSRTSCTLSWLSMLRKSIAQLHNEIQQFGDVLKLVVWGIVWADTRMHLLALHVGSFRGVFRCSPPKPWGRSSPISKLCYGASDYIPPTCEVNLRKIHGFSWGVQSLKQQPSGTSINACFIWMTNQIISMVMRSRFL